MKMESPSRFILLTLIFILVLLGVGISIASKKVRPEEIRAFITHELESQFPNATIKTSSVDFSLGVNSVVSINGLDIMLKKPRNFPLLHIDRLDFKIPFVALIFGGGKIDISARYPMIHLIKDGDFVNWSMARANVKKSKKILIPEIFKSSEINLSLSDIELVQKINSTSIRQQKIEKLVFKDLGIENPIAFEIFSKKISFGEEDKLTTLDLLLIGELEFTKEFLDGKISVKTSSSLTNIESKQFFKKIAKTLTIESNFDFENDSGIDGNINVLNEEMKILSSHFNYNKSRLVLTELKSEILIKDLVGNLSSKFQKLFNLNNRELIKISGLVEVGEEIKSNLSLITSESIVLRIGKTQYSTDFEGKIDDDGIVIKAKSSLDDGKIIAEIKSTGKIDSLFSKNSSNSLSLVMTDLAFDQIEVSNLISLDENEPGKLSQLGEYLFDIGFNLNLKLKVENMKLDANTLSGDVNILKTNIGYVVKSPKFRINKGDVKFSFSQIISENVDKLSIDINLDKINSEDFGKIFNDFSVFEITGIMSGSIKGDIQKGSYAIDTNLKYQKGFFNKFSLDNVLAKGDEVPSDFSLFKDGKFEFLNLSFSTSINKILVNNFEFKTANNESSLSGKGFLAFEIDQENEVNILLKTKLNELSKLKFLNTSKKSAQLKVRGAGFDFKIQ